MSNGSGLPIDGYPVNTGIRFCDSARVTRRADERIRTADPFITSEVLYQLSYAGGSAAF